MEVKLSREEFGLVWSAVLETGDLALGGYVKLMLEVQFLRK
jgi:hypothetical protein